MKMVIIESNKSIKSGNASLYTMMFLTKPKKYDRLIFVDLRNIELPIIPLHIEKLYYKLK
jgi:hypothetical protein